MERPVYMGVRVRKWAYIEAILTHILPGGVVEKTRTSAKNFHPTSRETRYAGIENNPPDMGVVKNQLFVQKIEFSPVR
jgi:hypothetical protein